MLYVFLLDSIYRLDKINEVVNIHISEMNLFDKLKPRSFTGYIMRRDEIVATIEQNVIIDCTQLAPLYIQRVEKNGGGFLSWIHDRGADLSRSYVRSILKHLGMLSFDVTDAVFSVNAASIVDTFWVKESSSSLTYKDVKSFSTEYFKAAIVGDPDLFSLGKTLTPEITNIGSFNKGWNHINGEWILFKSGTKLQIFSELFSAKLAIKLGTSAVNYWVEGDFIACKSFIKDCQCFEPVKSLVGSNTDYIYNADIMIKLGLIQQYVDILFIDTIVRNPDRHEFNYGFITDEDRSIKLAPNFDNNISLFANGVPMNVLRKDIMVSEFNQLLGYLDKNNIDYSLPDLNESTIAEVYEEIKDFSVPLQTLVDFCMNAYGQIM